MDVAEIGSFYVGGRRISIRGTSNRASRFTSDPNGDASIESMYVQYVRLTAPLGRASLLLWHGGGLTGSTYETKPDGNPGWQQYFLDKGWDVYVSDSVERGRSGWVPFRDIWSEEPFYRTNEVSWERFRIGPPGSYDTDPAKRRPFPETQFPVESFDNFAKYNVPRWDSNDAAIQRAYDALVERQSPCVIIAHSQGASFAFQAALNAPSAVKAVVIDEGGMTRNLDEIDFGTIAAIPHFFLFGDYIDRDAHWKASRAFAESYAGRLKAAGGDAEICHLPELGIRGNGHMNMMDRNSDEVAGTIQSWLESKGLWGT